MAIGKNFLENLTVAMYENSFTVYREFVQNSADSIDKAIAEGLLKKEEAIIDIHIEYGERRISVYDNACGISKDDFEKKMLDVADSDKDRDTEKGFRGIGRLAGLGYCDLLTFRTSFVGESVECIIKWDGAKLKSIVDDPKQHPTSEELIKEITTVEYCKASEDKHFFEVIMENVIFESDDLLDESQVIKYLQSVAPVPYANYFIFSSKIKEFAKENNFKIDEYCVLVNGNELSKPYHTRLYEGTIDSKKEYDEISDVDFKIFKNANGEPIAWLWYGISKYEKAIPVVNEMRCIRLRKENIQIGDENTIGHPKFYKEPRGNGYFIGEMFAVDKNLIPNARRDYFNQNHAQKQFEIEVHNFFYTELYNLYHYASQVRSAKKAVANFQKKEQEFNEKVLTASFIDSEERDNAQRDLEEERKKFEKKKREIANRKKDAEANYILDRVFKEISKDYEEKPMEAVDVPKTKKENKNKFLSQSLSQYSKKEQKLISKIYAIIKKILSKEMADGVIKKIQEELSK